jgi:YD repeat-containing protein
VSTYAWDTSQAPDAQNVTGASTYRLQFNWANFSGAARTDSIKITTTNTDSTQQIQTLTFSVSGIDSQAWASQPPTTVSTWGAVLAPDQITAGAATQDGHHYQLRLADGAVLTDHMLPTYNPGVPALDLMYSSTAADTKPIFVDHFQLDPTQAVPTRVSAQLTFNGVTGQTVWYDSSLLNPGDIMQIALQGNATGLATGRYNYSVAITAQYGSPVTTTNSGQLTVINPGNSYFGPGWSLDNYYRIWSVTGGVILEAPGGLSLWFANGQQSGTFVSPAGDFSTLVRNADNTYTRTMTDGSKYNFNTSGRQTSFVKTNGDTFTYGYNGSNQLTTITDFDNLATTLAYTNGQVSSITDPASRVMQIGHDGSGRINTITDPDSALWQFGSDSANRMTSLTDPRNKVANFTYNFVGRLSSVTRQDNTTEQLTPMQMQGFAAQGTGTSSANPATSVLAVQGFANYTDPRNDVWQTYLDWLGFGLEQQASDPLGDMSITRHDANGLAWLMADQVGDRTRSFFDTKGNPTKIALPDDKTQQYVYNSFSEVTQYTNPRAYCFPHRNPCHF